MRLETRNLILSLSAANLALVAVWRRLVLADPGERFWMRTYTAYDGLAAILNVLLLAAILYALLRLSRVLPPGRLAAALRALPVLLLLLPLSRVFGGNRPMEVFGHTGLLLVYLVSAAMAVFVLLRWRSRFETLILLLSPFLLFTLGQSGWLAATGGATAQAEAPAPQSSSAGGAATRVVWLVFDELDQRLAFDERPPGLELPEFDRLRAESLYATQVTTPGPATHVSIPALLTGRRVRTAWARDANELMVGYAGEEGVAPLSSQPTIFAAARDRGLRAAAIGWHMPYCRLFDGLLARCYWQPRRDPRDERTQRLGGAMLKQLQSLFYLLERSEHIVEQRTLMREARQAVADAGLDLVFVHLPVPHGPPIYERGSDEFTILNFGADWYQDNLALADHALGELRRTMEAAGLWDSSAVLLTSDHPWLLSATFDGKRDRRVPLLLKPAGDPEPLVYDQPLSATVSRDLVLALLDGEVRTAQEAREWLAKSGK